jgi:hypothetical protein
MKGLLKDVVVLKFVMSTLFTVLMYICMYNIIYLYIMYKRVKWERSTIQG